MSTPPIPSTYSYNVFSRPNQQYLSPPPSFTPIKFTTPPSFNISSLSSSTPVRLQFSSQTPTLSSSSPHFQIQSPFSSSPFPSSNYLGGGKREIIPFKSPQIDHSRLSFNDHFSFSTPRNTFSEQAFQKTIESTLRQVNHGTFSPSRPLFTQEERVIQHGLEGVRKSYALATNREGRQLVPSFFPSPIEKVNFVDGQMSSFSGKIDNFAFLVHTPTTNNNYKWTLEAKPLKSDRVQEIFEGSQVRKTMEATCRQVNHGTFSPEYPIWVMSADSLEALSKNIFEKMNSSVYVSPRNESHAITLADDSKSLGLIKLDINTHKIKSSVSGIFHGTVDFAINFFHDLQISAAHLMASELEINPYEKKQIFGMIEQSQAHRAQAVGNMVMGRLSIDPSDAVYQSFRYKTAFILEIGSLVYGGCGVVKGVVEFNRLAKMPMQIAKLSSKGAHGVEGVLNVRFHQAAYNLSEVGQNNIRVLRGWAKSKGWEKLPNTQGAPETWGNFNQSKNKFYWRLKIKPEASFREGLQMDSNIPRASIRLEEGVYINPFTGEVGGANIGGHIPLETLYYK